MSAHNALQNALYGPQPQYAQLATTNHQMAPPPANAPRYDGLIYRSSLLSFALPGAPPPASEWSVQSKACLDILGPIARNHDSSIEDPLENLTLYLVRLSRDQGLYLPSDQPATTLPDFLTRLTIHFALIAHDGAIFSSTILRYQYDRDAYNQPDSDIPIPTQLINSFQIVTRSIAEIRGLVSNLNSSWPSISASNSTFNDNNEAKTNSTHPPLTPLLSLPPEATQSIKDAAHYVDFYITPYAPALTALMKQFWDVKQGTEGRADGGSVVAGHMRWLMEQEDGDVRGRIKRTKLLP